MRSQVEIDQIAKQGRRSAGDAAGRAQYMGIYTAPNDMYADKQIGYTLALIYLVDEATCTGTHEHARPPQTHIQTLTFQYRDSCTHAYTASTPVWKHYIMRTRKNARPEGMVAVAGAVLAPGRIPRLRKPMRRLEQAYRGCSARPTSR
eukprot:6175405-Pleurochrysis_carterae.AAC.3